MSDTCRVGVLDGQLLQADSQRVEPDRNAWFKGGDAYCNVIPKTQRHPHRLVLLGAPGVGKGTQAELLCKRFGTCQLSTGDVFRAAKNLSEGERSPAIATALDCMKRGELVSDEIVLAMVAERAHCLRCGGGFLLDGFPRTVAQAEALERILEGQNVKLEAVVSYDLPLEKIVARLSGRRTCSKCKAVFHIQTRPPEKTGLCDHCGGELILREDDHPEAVRVRMEAYEKSTKPLIDFYQRRRLLLKIMAEGDPMHIYRNTVTALNLFNGNMPRLQPSDLG